MNKDETIAALDEIADSFGSIFGKAVFLISDTKLSRKTTKKRPYAREDLVKESMENCKRWFDDIRPSLQLLKVNQEIIDAFDIYFKKLLDNVYNIASEFHKADSLVFELFKSMKFWLIPNLYPLQESSLKLKSLDDLLRITSDVERNYLVEAFGCVRYRFFRAAIVLGWNAAIHRIHSVLTRDGLEKFNEASSEMKKIKKGRFKRFTREFTITSMNELSSTVFDTNLLQVIEYMGLISKDQHDRLDTCYTLRCDAAHPSNVPISYENLASFFSDLKSVVFENEKFAL